MRHLSTPALSLLALLAAPLAAQAPELSPGARVRFATAQRASLVTAVVLERSADSLRVAPEKGAPYTVAVGDLQRVAVSRGKSHAKGALNGALWGAGIGAAIGSLSASSSPNDCVDWCFDPDPATLAAATAIPSGLLGLFIGAAVGKESWDGVELKAAPTLRLGEDRRVRVAFQLTR